jgi:alpha-tubulin suppressor-like RCC1 family protein
MKHRFRVLIAWVALSALAQSNPALADNSDRRESERSDWREDQHSQTASHLEAAAVSASQIRLSWSDRSRNATGYTIERASIHRGRRLQWSTIASVGPNVSAYLDTGLSANRTYWYRVSARRHGKHPDDRDHSNLAGARTLPLPPSTLSATAVSTNQIDLAWTPDPNGQNGFKIERAPDQEGTPGAWAQVAQTAAQTITFSDQELKPGTVYWYRVRAFNRSGCSEFSEVAGATTLLPPCRLSVAQWGHPLEEVPAGLKEPVAISAGNSHNLALQSDGTVVGWGQNDYGEATPPAGLSNVMAVAAGFWHSLALKQEGTVIGWGYDVYGQATTPAGLSNVLAIAAGGIHSLALKNDGTVVGWGNDDYSQATPPAGLSNVVAIAAGLIHSLALKSDGTVVGWGYDDGGQATPPEGLSNVMAVAAGQYFSLALKNDGTVVGWGADSFGETIPPAGLSNVVAIAAGSYDSLALLSDGTVVAWGQDYYGPVSSPVDLTRVTAIAAGYYGNLALTLAPAAPTAVTATIVSPNEVELSWSDNSNGQAGTSAERAPDTNGMAGAWEQLGGVRRGLTHYSDTTVITNATYWYRLRSTNHCGDSVYTDPISVILAPPAAPSGLTAIVTDFNRVDLSWTDNSTNEESFGIERADDAGGIPGTWVQVATLAGGATAWSDTTVTPNQTYWYRVRASNPCGDSAAAESSVLVAPPPVASNLTATAVPVNQARLSWTDNSTDETGFKIERSLDGTHFTQIAQLSANTTSYLNRGLFPGTTYYYRVRAYKSTGGSAPSNVAVAATPVPSCPMSVAAWGDNSYGQVTPPRNLTGVVAVGAGYLQSLALMQDGTVVGWGYSYYATPPAGLTGIVGIAAGLYHSLAVKSDGTVAGWGGDSDGQATPPPGLSNVVAISGGYFHSLALKSDGTVVGWGNDSYGQSSSSIGFSNVIAIAGGYYHSLALMSDGTVVGWGDNSYGQAQPPVGLSGVVAIAAGGYHSLALKSDGTVVGWGANWYGQTAPPGGLTGVVAISAGLLHSLALKSDGTAAAWGYNAEGETFTPPGLNNVAAISAGTYHGLAVTFTPTAPATLSATPVAGGQIDLAWSEHFSAIDGFEIERAEDVDGYPGTWVQIATAGPEATSYRDTPGSGAAATPWYRVRAYNSCGQSAYGGARAPVILLDDTWNSGSRTNQDLPTSSAWGSSCGTCLTSSTNNMTLTVGGSSIMAITYFTPDSNSPPVWLNVGDTLTASFNFVFNGIPTVGSSSQGFRIGLFNFADGRNDPKRVGNDGFSSGSQGSYVNGYALFGKMYRTFRDQTPIDIRKRTTLADASLLGTSGDWTSLAKDFVDTNGFGGFDNLTPYSLLFVVQRTGLNSMAITVTWSNMVTGVTLSDSAIDSSATSFGFDGISYRPQNNTQAPAVNQFNEVKIELTSVQSAPTIITQPRDRAAYDGEAATFSVVAGGTLPLRYQWYYNTNSPVADATNATLTLAGVRFADAGVYSVVVSNPYGTVNSATARLTVSATAPSITRQPQDVTILPGQSATFSVETRGSEPKSYQWYHNTNSPVPDATNSTWTLNDAQTEDSGTYSVLVSNAVGFVASRHALLTVTSLPFAPSGLTATAVSRSEIDLGWTDNSGNEDEFQIERAPDAGGVPGAWTSVATVSSNVTIWLDTALSPQTKYWYRVRAQNVAGDSADSNLAAATTFGSDLAFPGAEGFGAYAAGGRGGAVYHVTHLGDSGPGSLRDGVSAPNRTIVFDVSGTIDLLSSLVITSPNLTIAGQTAPGDGITLKGWLTSVQDTHDVVVRYIRCRPGDVNCPYYQEDAFHVVNSENVIVDHVSASWSVDETLSVSRSANVTVQWCMITESLNCSCHAEGCHGYGSLLRYGDGGLSFHHNLYAEHWSRNPRLGDSLRLDFVNNVIYNWQDQAGYNGNDGADNPGGYTNYLNYVGNYLIAGPNTAPPKRTTAFHSNVPDPAFAWIHQSGNLMDTNVTNVLAGVDLGWSAFIGTFAASTNRLAFPRVDTDEATAGYLRVLSAAGASVARDAVDARVVSNVVSRTGAIINSQNDVGGWPTLASSSAPTDSDQDGMPDFWELALGLNPDDPADRNASSPDGYTRLEEYLNWLTVPRAGVQTNAVTNVDLRLYTAGLQDPVYAVSNPTHGTVMLLSDGYTAQFTPTPGFSGLASFTFTATGVPGNLAATVNVVVTPMVYALQTLVSHTDGAASAPSGFSITAFALGPPVRVYFPSLSNHLYTLYSASSLSGTGAWTNVPGQTDIMGADGVGVLTDTNIAPAKFYRVGVRLP